EYIQINTKNILFVCGGTFEGLEDFIEQRVNKDAKSIGFTARVGMERVPKEFDKLIGQVVPEDLLQFGLIPEFVGRLPIIVGVGALDKDALVRILTEPKNAIVKQYQRIFTLDNVELVFKQKALEEAASMALGHKTGARGLRAIIEEALMDVMYDVPSLDDVVKCIIDADVIAGKRHPLLLTSDGQSVGTEQNEEKTA
ncbi:MAG: AAA family ATPase, partial [Dehalococcoidia bacterium]